MSTTGVTAFDSTLHATHVWLNDICDKLERDRDPQLAYRALRAVLHALRDRLGPDEAAGFAAQLPLLIKGVFYDGWHPAGKPSKARSADEFLAPVADAFWDDGWFQPDRVARAVFAVVKRHVSAGEVADVLTALPGDVRTLWA